MPQKIIRYLRLLIIMVTIGCTGCSAMEALQVFSVASDIMETVVLVDKVHSQLFGNTPSRMRTAIKRCQHNGENCFRKALGGPTKEVVEDEITRIMTWNGGAWAIEEPFNTQTWSDCKLEVTIAGSEMTRWRMSGECNE